MEVKFPDPERMNLIGYFLRDILQTNLSSEESQKAARKLKGTFLISASSMDVTLSFNGESIVIYRGSFGKINSRVKGDLNALLDIVLGTNYLIFLFRGKIKVGGNLFKLLKVMKFLRIDS
ncbi:MAG: SCP2 sterol-binding domain-containing protein [bacterium]